jgi:hypothetical protein
LSFIRIYFNAGREERGTSSRVKINANLTNDDRAVAREKLLLREKLCSVTSIVQPTMPPRYSNEELAQMLLIYGECRQSERRAAALYAIRYPDRRHPSPSTFGNLYRRLCQSGTVHESTRPRNIRQRDEQMIDQVREAVLANPHTSTRCIARDLNITQSRVHKVIKKDLKWHPYKRHTTQKLFPQDLPRRERFCEWISDQVSSSIYVDNKQKNHNLYNLKK